MGKADIGMIEEIGGNVERFAGKEMAKQVMAGSTTLKPATDKTEIALWVKEAVNRLDNLVDKDTGIKIMENCGYKCSSVNKRVIEGAKARRSQYKNTEEFLEAEQRKPMTGTRLERKGNILYFFYTPQSYTRPLRCYCSLFRSLPATEKVSRTYCHCSKGFVKKLWEAVLEKPLMVELVESVISGAGECQFIIHL